MQNTPVASYSLTVRVTIANKPGMLGKVTSAIGEAGGDIGAVDLVEAGQKEMTRDITFKSSDEAHGQRIVERLRGVPTSRWSTCPTAPFSCTWAARSRSTAG